jgi:rhodanese-related sulfurtransferase
MRTLSTVFLLSCALALPGCATSQATQTATEAPAAEAPAAEEAHADMSWSDVKSALGEGAILVDARGAGSYTKGHIPGAISVPASDDGAMERLPEAKDTRLIYYCGGPKCPASTKAAAKASAAGYTQVADFRGGYPAWKARYGLDGSVDRAVPEGIEVLDWAGTEAAMSAGAVLVDSRGSKGFESGHIAGAINVPYKDEAAHSALPEDKATAVIFYCSGPVCSASTKGAEKAQALGYSNVKEYRGGYPDWASRQ